MKDELLRESMVRIEAETKAINQASSVWELDDNFRKDTRLPFSRIQFCVFLANRFSML